MPKRTSAAGSELFIVDNSDVDWKVVRYLHDWCQISKSIDVATGYFEIGALLALKDEWQKVDQIRILMGDEVCRRTRDAFVRAACKVLDESLEKEKAGNDFLSGVPAIVEAIRSGKISCRVYRKEKFHAKAYITNARLEVVGSAALVGSSNLTYPGITENIELNVQITGRPVTVLQEWYEEHWKAAEDVTPEILRTIERHTEEYKPFDVYARGLHELFHRHGMTDDEWLRTKSRAYPKLDQYQKDGFQDLMAIAAAHRGAFLCDGVGLGKTFIGLMVIEYLVERMRKRVALIVPKSGRRPVWEYTIKTLAPELFGRYSGLMILNHTDLLRQASEDIDYPALVREVRDRADAIVIDEAHHFRNPGLKGEGGERKSHYWQLFDTVQDKPLYLLTATPINNHLIDLQHMIELFSRRQPDYFKASLGINSLPGHFRAMENDLERMVLQGCGNGSAPETNQVEAARVLSNDSLFRALVVQRSRSFVKKSQEQDGSSARAIFPEREDPQVVKYDLKKTYGPLLLKFTRAFDKEKPLFSLAVYYPLAYYNGPDKSIDPMREGRQKEVVSLIKVQFLKRFESSSRAFEMSCETLLQKLLAWIVRNEPEGEGLRRFNRWKDKYGELLGYVRKRQLELWGEAADEEPEEEEDIVPAEMVEDAEFLSRDEYKVDDIVNETIDDLNQIAEFLEELRKLKTGRDDKLKNLVKLLKGDPVLRKQKVIIFSEYMATARYLRKELKAAGIDGVDEVDSATKQDRGEIIRRFSPYYNGTSSVELEDAGRKETRVLISTDVLSEGLNLQDATRLVNYDLHWNPVRLMQRIGRVDRRMNADTEARILADHPEQEAIRGHVAFWNFLPPKDLDEILKLYKVVSRKTLRISKVFGIEGKKLLTPEDDYEALKDFYHTYEGDTTPLEELHLEYHRLLNAYPELMNRLETLPNRIFSGREHPTPEAKAVFFCYALPAPVVKASAVGGKPEAEWVADAGESRWYLYDLTTETIVEAPAQIARTIRCAPETPRRCQMARRTLSEIRARIDKRIKDTYLKSINAPQGVTPPLKAWMELS